MRAVPLDESEDSEGLDESGLPKIDLGADSGSGRIGALTARRRNSQQKTKKESTGLGPRVYIGAAVVGLVVLAIVGIALLASSNLGRRGDVAAEKPAEPAVPHATTGRKPVARGADRHRQRYGTGRTAGGAKRSG